MKWSRRESSSGPQFWRLRCALRSDLSALRTGLEPVSVGRQPTRDPVASRSSLPPRAESNRDYPFRKRAPESVRTRRWLSERRESNPRYAGPNGVCHQIHFALRVVGLGFDPSSLGLQPSAVTRFANRPLRAMRVSNPLCPIESRTTLPREHRAFAGAAVGNYSRAKAFPLGYP